MSKQRSINRWSAGCYHDDQDCPQLTKSEHPARETTCDRAQNVLQQLPCSDCVLETGTTGDRVPPPEKRYADLIARDAEQRDEKLNEYLTEATARFDDPTGDTAE